MSFWKKEKRSHILGNIYTPGIYQTKPRREPCSEGWEAEGLDPLGNTEPNEDIDPQQGKAAKKNEEGDDSDNGDEVAKGRRKN